MVSAATTTSAPLKKFWTVAEVCDRLGVGKTLVYAMVKKGWLEVIYLPSPPSAKRRKARKPRKGIPRITGESLARYERGEVATATPSRPATRPTRPPPAKLGRIPHFH